MSTTPPIDSLTEALSKPLEKLYKAGNLALVFVFVGTLLLLVALFLQKTVFNYFVGIFGFLIITVTLYLFYIKEIKPTKILYKELKERKEINDIFKESSVRMANIAANLHELMINNSHEIEYLSRQYQEVILPILEFAEKFNLPQAKSVVNNKYAIRTKNLTATILKFTHDTEKTIKDVRFAIAESDTKTLKKYYNQLEDIDQRLQELLKSVNSIPPRTN